MLARSLLSFLFFFNDTATPEIYTLSLHDALPISNYRILGWFENGFRHISNRLRPIHTPADMKGDRKSTRLNSSHVSISYAVFCLKKKNKNNTSIFSPSYCYPTITHMH